ncbi:MAG: HU family DNA-binding protein [Bacteroidales bacterium]|jgi:predicted histone-like DNA-binding protein|nr:HU family DNA-binding protein [Bacteroidales bacterium]
MKYKLIQRTNPQNRNSSKWYAAPVNDGHITKSEITRDLMDLSSLSRGDVSNVIENLIEALPKYLLMGKSVRIGEFGTLRLSFSSDGVDNPADFSTGKISGVKIIFTPGAELKRKLTSIKLEKTE